MFEVDYDLAQSNKVCNTAVAWAQVPSEPSADEREALIARIKRITHRKKALLVAHYYVHPDLQDLAEATGGIVSDSLEMARFGATIRRKPWWWRAYASWANPPKSSPEKPSSCPICVPNARSISVCPIDEFSAFCDAHPDRTVVV